GSTTPLLAFLLAAALSAVPVMASYAIASVLSRRHGSWLGESVTPPRAGSLRIAACAVAALGAYLLFLRVMSPPGFRSIAGALRDPPRAGQMAPDFALADLDGA